MRRSTKPIRVMLIVIGLASIAIVTSIALSACGGTSPRHRGSSVERGGIRSCPVRQLVSVGKAMHDSAPDGSWLFIEQEVRNIGSTCIFHVPVTIEVMNALGDRARVRTVPGDYSFAGGKTSVRIPGHKRRAITIGYPTARADMSAHPCEGEIRNVSAAAVPLKDGNLRFGFGGVLWGQVCNSEPAQVDVIMG